MVREPELFLLDEPLSNLDAKLRTEMRVTISKLHKQINATFIYVTHDQTEAMTMADRIVIMKDGFIQQADTPRNVYLYPANLFVATFIGTPQINLISARIEKIDDSVCGPRFGLRFDCRSEHFFDLPADRFSGEVLEEYVNRPVIAGLRPEAVQFCGTEELGNARIEFVEELGSESYYHVDYGGQRMTVKDGFDTGIREGDTVLIHFNLNQAHLFDSETEKSLPVQRVERLANEDYRVE